MKVSLHLQKMSKLRSFANKLAKLYKSGNIYKIILTMDKTINNDYNGIKIINIINWLLTEE